MLGLISAMNIELAVRSARSSTATDSLVLACTSVLMTIVLYLPESILDKWY